MPLVNAEMVKAAMYSYRLVWINGRFGGGKTSVAMRFAQEFLEDGYRLITNNKCIWADSLEDTKLLEGTNHLKAVIVLDEGGLEFKSSKQIEEIAAYAAKMDCIYIIPSFFPPTSAAQVLTIQPLWNLIKAGVPIITYRWQVKIGGFSDKGSFYWFLPSEIYGVYSRQDPGSEASDIIHWLVTRKEEYKARHGHRANGLPALESVTEFDVLRDAVQEMAQAADTIASVPVRRHRRR